MLAVVMVVVVMVVVVTMAISPMRIMNILNVRSGYRLPQRRRRQRKRRSGRRSRGEHDRTGERGRGSPRQNTGQHFVLLWYQFDSIRASSRLGGAFRRHHLAAQKAQRPSSHPHFMELYPVLTSFFG